MKKIEHNIPFQIPEDWIDKQTGRGLKNSLTTFDIEHRKRKYVEGDWKFARTAGYPLNVMMTFNVVNTIGTIRRNVYFCRYAAHKYRSYCRRHGFPSVLIWTRTADVGSTYDEQVSFLFHVPGRLQDDFIRLATDWGVGVEAKKVGYDPIPYGTGSFTPFEILFRATSLETQTLEPSALSVRSGPIVSYRSFSSKRLGLPAKQAHRKANKTV